MGYGHPLSSPLSPLARRAPLLDGANPSKLLLTYALSLSLSFPFPSSLFGSYLRMYYYYWKRSLASTPLSILAAAAASLIAAATALPRMHRRNSLLPSSVPNRFVPAAARDGDGDVPRARAK